jgi:hypothetical protein
MENSTPRSESPVRPPPQSPVRPGGLNTSSVAPVPSIGPSSISSVYAQQIKGIAANKKTDSIIRPYGSINLLYFSIFILLLLFYDSKTVIEKTEVYLFKFTIFQM